MLASGEAGGEGEDADEDADEEPDALEELMNGDISAGPTVTACDGQY